MKQQLLEFYVTGVDDIMIIKFAYKIRIVIGTVCCFEIYSTESLDDNASKSPTIEIVTAEQIGAED